MTVTVLLFYCDCILYDTRHVNFHVGRKTSSVILVVNKSLYVVYIVDCLIICHLFILKKTVEILFLFCI